MKKYKILFSSTSLSDIDEAVEYYNKQSLGLGNKFLDNFASFLKSINLNPRFASVKYDEIRYAAFKKFPFSVHYTLSTKNQTVTIVAVFNTWKEPFW
ncbi:MAG: type II toxin-antitoxin system RelE/ParE family toxin [Chitinophagaceae bacterium]